MYSPRLSKEQIKKLYQLSKITGEPMTWLVREAVEIYLKRVGDDTLPPLFVKNPAVARLRRKDDKK